jgi:hypothetical protein
MLADEAYLQGDTGSAGKYYSQAAAELQKATSAWKVENSATSSMLEADIAYRQTLLRYGADFWGSAYSLTPINPVEAFERFKSTVAALDELVVRVEAAQERVLKALSASGEIAAMREAAKTDNDVQALNRVIEEMKATHHGAKATAARARIDSNVTRQKEIASQRVELSAQFDAVHKQFDSLVVNGVLQASGLPPDLAALADQDRPLEQRILQVGKGLVAANSDAIKTAFSNYSAATASVVENLQRATDAVEDVQKLKRTSEAAIGAIRRGTLEGALEAGRLVYAQLPEADRKRLGEIATKETKPVLALLDSAKQAKTTLDAVTSIVAGDARMTQRLGEVLIERATANSTAFDRWYRDRLLQASAAAKGTSTQLLVEQAARAWPKAFYAELPPEVKAAIRDARKTNDDVRAAREAFGQWPPLGVSVAIVEGKAEISAGGKKTLLDVTKFIDAKATASLEAVAGFAEEAARMGEDSARQALKTHASAIVAAALKDREGFVRPFAASLHNLDSSASLSRLLPTNLIAADGQPSKAELDKAFDEVWQKLPESARTVSAEQMAVMQAGSIVGKDVIAAPGRVPANRAQFDGTTGGRGSANEALLWAAASAAFPAAGLVKIGVDAIQALGTMNSLADRINRLTAEDRAIMSEQLTLYDLVVDEDAAAALAEVGIRVAERRRVGAESQISRYNETTSHLDEAELKARGAQRLYMPRAFLLAEQLRYRFDQLDRSLAFWTGDPRIPRGQIARNIQTDPAWIRYALDPAIDVFRWLERGGESDRGDMRKLAEDWQRRLVLASTACDALKCTKDTAVVGEVAISQQFSMRTAFPDQWKKFEAWKSTGGGDFSFDFLLTPKLLQTRPEMHLVRFVNARAGILRANIAQSSQGSALYHPGAAYVALEGDFIKEHYIPASMLNPTWEEPFGQGLRTRWTTSLALRPLEGYSLYTVWRYSLQDTAANRSADDVFIQFAYQYQNKQRVLSDADIQEQRKRKLAWHVAFKTLDKVSLKISLEDLPFAGSEESAKKTIDTLLSIPVQKGLGIVDASLREESGATK